MSGSNSDAESNSAQRDSILEQFKNVTGTNNDSARAVLEACNWNLELAINMHVDGIESTDVIELPSNRSSNHVNSSNSTQNDNPDFVRAPIPPVRQILVEDNFSPVIMSRRAANAVFDSFRDFQSEAIWQEQQLRSSNGESSSSFQDQATISKKKTLEDLYRPPLDIMFRGTLEACKEEGTNKNRWLLVNVQNVKEFACQVLNRDVWSNSIVKEIIKEHFIFWQIYLEQSEGQRYVQFYNVHSYPYVSILDPRTGEKLRTFTATDAGSLCEFITEFINEHPTPNGQSNSSTPATPSILPSSSSKRDSLSKKIYDQSEEAQLEAAIAASLQEITNQDEDKKNDDDSNSNADCQIYSECEPSFADLEDEVKPIVEENWKDFLAPKDDKVATIKLRFPDYSFEQIAFPANSQVKALFLYIKSKGFDPNLYELTTPYPKRVLNDLKSSDTLIEAGLYPKTLVCIQSKQID